MFSRRIAVTLVALAAAIGASESLAHAVSADERSAPVVVNAPSSVVRVRPRDLRDLRIALAVTDDVWSHEFRGDLLDVLVSRSARSTLERAGVPFEVLIDDVQALIDAQAQDRAVRLQRRIAMEGQGGVAGEDWYADVKNLAAIETRLAEWVAAHPTLVTPFVAGTSVQGRPIRGIRISLAPVDAAVPAFLFNACQHAREWATPMTAMLLAEHLIDGSASDPEITAMLASSEVLVIPVSNPDGYQYSWDAVRLWRKNRSDNGDGTFGVDLNRNWDYQWGGPGSSGNSSSETYRGPSPFSEPETQALRDLITANGRIIGHIDIHSYSQLLLWPWGWTEVFCVDQPLFAALGSSMVGAIADEHGRQYTAGPINSTLYAASGSAVDWAYGTAAVYSTTVEVRDTGAYGFLIPPAEVRPCAEENVAGAIAMMRTLLVPGFLAIEGSVPSIVEPESTTSVTVYAAALASNFSGPPRLHARVGTTAPFTAVEMSAIGDSRFVSALPAAPCGAIVDWFVDWQGAPESVSLPADVEFFRSTASTFEVVFIDALEVDSGWVSGAPGDTASSGQWMRVDPVGTTAQPDDDHTPVGTHCWVTGQGVPGGAAGAADVDNGITSLTTPWLDGNDPDAILSYWRWYSNNLGAAPNEDSMLVLHSTDGVSWSLLEEVSQSATAWVEASFRIGDFVAPPSAFKLRFVARDLGAGSLVEAAIDDLSIEAAACAPSAADLNSDGVVNGADLALLLGAWGACSECAADITGDGIVNGADLAALLGAWG